VTADFRIIPAGDAALLVEFADRMDAAINARVVHLWQAARRARLPGVRDVVPAYRSLAVYFDPLRTDVTALVAFLERSAADTVGAEVTTAAPRRVPVCYGGDFGPDLDLVAAAAGLSVVDAIAAHCAPVYRVFMIGFSPGFAYMGTVDSRIAVPRRATPRVNVPAGSVAIAGKQTGIYPSDTPGGWMLVGRTPVRPFDPSRPNPFLFKAGDGVQFHPIDVDEYRRLADPAGGGR
jgi:KipI family sensor histidine kinase inhibitor